MKTSEMKINETGTTYNNDAWVVRTNLLFRSNRFVPIFSFNVVFTNENKGAL